MVYPLNISCSQGSTAHLTWCNLSKLISLFSALLNKIIAKLLALAQNESKICYLPPLLFVNLILLQSSDSSGYWSVLRITCPSYP